jgi:phosphatidylglycerol:prolipoprotein diacylglycerol transferase
MYLLGFLSSSLSVRFLKERKCMTVSGEKVVFLFIMLGLILGAYLGKIGALEFKWAGIIYPIGFLSSYLIVRSHIGVTGLALSGGEIAFFFITFILVFGMHLGAHIGKIDWWYGIYLLVFIFSIFIVHAQIGKKGMALSWDDIVIFYIGVFTVFSLGVRIGYLETLEIRWYGVMYPLGFIFAILVVRTQFRKKGMTLSGEDIEKIFIFTMLGLAFGARIGYILIYNAGYYAAHPTEIILWQGGMSFHGGLIGAVAAPWFYCRRRGLDFAALADISIVSAPIGLGLGRIGNFINAELYGRPTDVPWGMVFPNSDGAARHPSQLYESFLEGVVLFAILWFLKERVKTRGGMVCMFLIFYGALRFTAEFFREPDMQMGYFIFNTLTMGQILCLAMTAAGAAAFAILRSKEFTGNR